MIIRHYLHFERYDDTAAEIFVSAAALAHILPFICDS